MATVDTSLAIYGGLFLVSEALGMTTKFESNSVVQVLVALGRLMLVAKDSKDVEDIVEALIKAEHEPLA